MAQADRLAVYRSLRCEQGAEKGPAKNAVINLLPVVNSMTNPISIQPSSIALALPGRGTARHWAAATLLLALTGAAVSVAHAQPAGTLGAAPGMAPGAMHAAAHPGMGYGMAHGMGHGMGHGMAGSGMMSERMLDGVGATAEQKTKVRDLLKSAQDDMRKQHESDHELHQKMMALLAAPQVDAAAAETLRQQLQARRDVASKRQLQAMLDVSAVLTPEQRQKLTDRMKTRQDMMQRHQRERQAIEPRS